VGSHRSVLSVYKNMRNLITLGRVVLALAVLAFGVQSFIYATSGSGFGPPFTPENHLVAGFEGIVLLLAGAGMVLGKQVRCAAIALGVVLLLRAVIYDLPKLVATPRNPGPWTSGFELLALSSASLMLAAISTKSAASGRVNSRFSMLFLGRILFAASLVVFAVQHLIYGPFVAGLIPTWIPGHLFWAYFVGGAFIAAALAIGSGRLASLAAVLLGTMFFLWVLVLHAPRVAGALHDGNEWTSLFVALAMSGCAFIISGIVTRRSVR
jgi:uncharacterized membrane protein